MDHLLTRILHLHHRSRGSQATWMLMFAVSLLLWSFSTVPAQQIRIEGNRLVPAKRDSLTMKRDSLATKSDRLVPVKRDSLTATGDTLATKSGALVSKDSTQILLVTTAPDSSAQLPDSARAAEAHPQDTRADRGFMIRTETGNRSFVSSAR